MADIRRRFHDELAALESELLVEGEVALNALERAMTALSDGNVGLADDVIAGDDEVDRHYMSIERGTLELLALQTPVASDLRLLSALIHINVHLERVGDMAVNIAKAVKLTRNLPSQSTILEQLREMGSIARRMVAASLAAFRDRDLAGAQALPSMDDPIDDLNRGMVTAVAACASDPGLLEWAIRMMIVSRQLERVGDHAVDIGEQVAFLVTGEFQEFTDASHPELEHPERAGR